MKKLLGFLVVGLLSSNISYSKISEEYYNLLYENCMIEATKANKANLEYTIIKNYCKCSADHFDKNYDDKSLIAFVEQGGPAYNDVVAFVISKCRRKVGLD